MKSAAWYVLLVIAPLAGLLAVLRVGERLTPPRAVWGVWHIEEPWLLLDGHACIQVQFEADRPSVSISQSGPRVTLVFNDVRRTTFEGKIDRSRLVARPAHQPDPVECEDLTLQLEFGPPTPDGRPRLVGKAGTPGCPACEEIALGLRRRPASAT